ncbi:protein of unknown function [Nitrospira japonica]|uniref:Uncharacterized protein n=1 Tax=Nitrospira japonica TaxID=1325564 RepID=A0A1W1I499_9BACT|nr:protein of unknown function [Nitrospira japonica]
MDRLSMDRRGASPSHEDRSRQSAGVSRFADRPDRREQNRFIECSGQASRECRQVEGCGGQKKEVKKPSQYQIRELRTLLSDLSGVPGVASPRAPGPSGLRQGMTMREPTEHVVGGTPTSELR